MTTIIAKSILASRNALDLSKRIDTLLLRYPRCIHAEFMTHRVFSRNAASSRAIPVKKLIQDVINDPFVPLYWGENQKGMQAGEEINTQVWLKDHSLTREEAWEKAMWAAIHMAEAFDKAGYHKQIINRLLEPFSHITVVVTSTQWSNFLALRDHPDAEPHIQILAKRIREALDGAQVEILNPGVWHLPFVSPEEHFEYTTEQLKILSVARCASTSYKTVDGFDMTLERASEIYEKLIGQSPMHASPFEHQAQADNGLDFLSTIKWNDIHGLGGNLGPGWIQLRKTLPGECL